MEGSLVIRCLKMNVHADKRKEIGLVLIRISYQKSDSPTTFDSKQPQDDGPRFLFRK